jgi:Protein of unknown function (DUF3800)
MPPVRRDFIGELCIALAHRWEPERLFVIFTAYFDEAASHGPSPRLVMGALLGNAYEWRRLETHLRRLQAKYGFTIFHAKDFKAHKDEFRGWPPGDYPALVSDLTDLIRTTLTEGVTMTLPRDRYLAEYRAPPVPSGMRLDSQYGLCFRACLAHLVDIILSRGGKNHTLHVVIESGHTNVRDTDRIFNEIKLELEERGIRLLGTITVAQKTDPNAKPLMVADFLAHSHYLFDSASQAGKAPTYEDMTVGVPNKKYDAGLTFLKFEEGSLQAIKQRFAENRQRRMDAWRAARDARAAGVLTESAGIPLGVVP